MKKKKSLTYKGSGVDTKAGEKAVKLIKKSAQKTFRFLQGKAEILSGIGGFSAAVKFPDGRILLSSTDGVGTKLKLSIISNFHKTVGIDLVAMCVNDILAVGGDPLWLLDYVAMGVQKPIKTAEILEGINSGCEEAECSLIGGEMAELKVMYGEGEYDMAGFAVGQVVSEKDLILGKDIKPGMNAYGLLSSGVHSNGFSLIWKTFGIDFNKPDKAIQKLDKYYPELGRPLISELIKPTKIYTKDIKDLTSRYRIRGMVHITGGAFVENPPRVLPDNCAIQVDTRSWEVPPIFQLIQEKGNVSKREMYKTFNMGIAFLLITPDEIPELVKVGKIVKRKVRGRKVLLK